MSNSLTETQIKAYRRDGFLSPIAVLSAPEAAAYRARFEAYEAANQGWYPLSKGQKLYLLQTWVAELAAHPKVLDAVESVLGPNLMVWGSSLFIKDPGEGTYVTWHQDSTYWGLSKPEVTTAWIALSPATAQSGCMKMMPGTHKWDQLAHVDTLDEKNLLTRGQEIAVEVNEADGVLVELEPGQMSLHDVQIVHASDPNQANDRRIGVAIRYITPRVSQLNAQNDSAWLVRGEDSHGHFIHETPPKADMDPAALAEHERIMKIRQDVLFRGVDGKPAHG
ncbi:MAG: phytanoyl-CoA dioxygenase family protein [Rhodospirillales bacterium]|nr:phytanoyl-CoA dioxygenase family protein [Rhodospirillales bacterium]